MKRMIVGFLSAIFIFAGIIPAGSLKAQSDEDAYWATKTEKESADRRSQTGTYIETPPVTVGMTKEQVTALLGEPRIVNRLPTKDGNQEQWSYGHPAYGTNRYIYFDEKGMVTGIQEEK